MPPFWNGLLLGLGPAFIFLSFWLSTRGKLRALRETTEDIRAWDRGYLTEAEPTGRHAAKAEAVAAEPEPEPVTIPIVAGTKRTAMWYDLITQWAEAHEPAVNPTPPPPRLEPVAWAARTQVLPVVGVNVTRLPQIEEMIAAPAPTPEPLPTTTWPIWGPEPVEPGATILQQLGHALHTGVRLGLIEFESSGQRINAWVTAAIERRIIAFIPAVPQAKIAIRPKRMYPLAASTTRWEYRGGAR